MKNGNTVTSLSSPLVLLSDILSNSDDVILSVAGVVDEPYTEVIAFGDKELLKCIYHWSECKCSEI